MQNCFQACQRRFYWNYEKQLKASAKSDALWFGAAWAKAMEQRWLGHDASSAFTIAITDSQMDEYVCSSLCSLLAAYYVRWPMTNELAFKPEQEFSQRIAGTAFIARGKIDGLLVSLGTTNILENKTSGEDISPGSDFWIRCKFNPQVLQYASAHPSERYNVFYDVTAKTNLRPSQIPLLDDAGLKMVLNPDGTRATTKKGEPRQTSDKELGQVLQTRAETPDEFGDRVYADATGNLDKYFQRKEVPILDSDLGEFCAHRMMIIEQIKTCRRSGRKYQSIRCNEANAWTRTVNSRTCSFCEYQSFCLSGIYPDAGNIPTGFYFGVKNEELNQTV